ncbi:hypothetical protein Asppvi_005872 [Aspergillus pseudoviridinutans]|uniref:Uncharacterized protein n=1 Tax=Aspergillus pseudoviridinutans TaxID=1517512 RepID=A0A9P3BER5_9EURO|nr:uncharacterized protein Asppvi_005872 [Aspergillus pseudoviridinutans]GIJ86973.1 hypothetical protein Asppvi_005872 [Aspergillus pseudoviridinutans]
MTDLGSETSSMSTTADHACDLCGCLLEGQPQSEPYPNYERQDVRLAIQALHRLCDSLDRTSIGLMHELGNMTSGQDRLRRELAEAEKERDALQRRLNSVETAYEAKSILYDTTRELFDKLMAGFDLRVDREDRGSVRYRSRLSPIKE